MLSFREYVSAVGSSIRTVASRKFKETYDHVLSDSKIVMLDKSGKYVLNRWHSPRLNIMTEGNVQGEWVSDTPPLDSTAWIGFRPAIKENVPNGEIAVRFGVGIPLTYNRNKYIIADEYRLTHIKELRSHMVNSVILPARKMLKEAEQELSDAKTLIIPDDENTLKYGQHFKFLHFEFMYNFYENKDTYERIPYTGKDLTIIKKKRKKSFSDLSSAINNIKRDIKELEHLLSYIEKKKVIEDDDEQAMIDFIYKDLK